ncbi:MAG: membrane protein insertion efficiency factor YidD [Pseudomonadota bacterium]
MNSQKSESRLRPVARLMLAGYKATLSPLLALFGARCRHGPTCSEYAAEAISRHGIWRGGWMALARLQRCRPGGSMGYDPVPDAPKHAPWWAPWRYGDWRGPRPDDQ